MNSDNFQRLGAFYRRKRESLLPEELGLPKAARRSRTPGLRREDVAYLVGVSAVWYSKIERGKIQGVSVTTIESLNRVLQLTKDEIDYVHRLLRADHSALPIPPCTRLSSYSKRVLDLLNPLPALVLNDYLDIIYANQAFTLMSGININALDIEQRNYAQLTITSPVWREWLNIADTQSVFELLTQLAGILRSNQAARPTDQRIHDLINHLQAISPSFTKAWQENRVQKAKLDLIIKHSKLNATIPFIKQILHNGSGETSGKINVYHPENESDYERLFDIFEANKDSKY